MTYSSDKVRHSLARQLSITATAAALARHPLPPLVQLRAPQTVKRKPGVHVQQQQLQQQQRATHFLHL